MRWQAVSISEADVVRDEVLSLTQRADALW
jgi:hypothetical protein